MQYRYFSEGQLKVDPTTGTKCRTGQLNHQFVEQKYVDGVWVGIGDNDGVRYGDVAGAGCRFREGMRDGDYTVDVETEIAGFLLAENDGWVNCGSVSGYWYPLKDSVFMAKLLFWGKYSEITAGQMPNKVTGAIDFLTVAGIAGSETFQCPNTAPYKNADTDYIWFKIDASQRTTTTAELIGYDFPRTIIKYDNISPYTLREIIILKAGETLTTVEENLLRDYMNLSVWWSNTLSSHGNVKENRGIGQNFSFIELTGTLHNTTHNLSFSFDGINLAASSDVSAGYPAVVTNFISGAYIGDQYLLKYTDFHLISGATPDVAFRGGSNGIGGSWSNVINLIQGGTHSTIFTLTNTDANHHTYFAFLNYYPPTNYTVSGLSLRKYLQ